MFNSLPTYKKVGLIASIVGTVLFGGGLALAAAVPDAGRSGTVLGAIVSVFMTIGFIGTIVAYATGGIVEAFKSALTIGKWGWLIMPFPVDIFTGLASSMFALLIFLAVPVYPVYKSCRKYLDTHIAMEPYMY